MKTIYITLICAVMVALSGINANAETRYCEVWAEQKAASYKCVVRMDYGQEREGAKTSRGGLIRGEDGKPIAFESVMGGINRLIKEGWEFVAVFGGDKEPHFIMKREE